MMIEPGWTFSREAGASFRFATVVDGPGRWMADEDGEP
jgi:hypothetical protein